MLTTITFCAERLAAESPDPPISQVELHEIYSAAVAIDSLIDASDLPYKLKLVLLDLTRSIRDSIQEFKYRGVSGLREELFLVLERLHRNIEDLREHAEKPAVQGVWELVTRFDTVSSLALNLPQLMTNAQGWLTMPL